jgi:hypothetical protein
MNTAALQSSPTEHPSLSGPEPFSDFHDKLHWAGTKGTTQYWKGAHRPFFDRIMASLTGKVLWGDHTFKVAFQILYFIS